LWDAANCGGCGRPCDADHPICDRGTCHTCDYWGLLACGGVCKNRWDPANCGACGNVCGAGTTGQCLAEHCQTCAEVGLGDCGGICMDIMWSHDRCGACDHACGADETCVLGACVVGDGTSCATVPCAPTRLCCANSGVCVDPRYDDSNCGGCGHGCAVNEGCSNGVCVVTTGGGGGGGD
jgi:hypothetical protein